MVQLYHAEGGATEVSTELSASYQRVNKGIRLAHEGLAGCDREVWWSNTSRTRGPPISALTRTSQLLWKEQGREGRGRRLSAGEELRVRFSSQVCPSRGREKTTKKLGSAANHTHPTAPLSWQVLLVAPV